MEKRGFFGYKHVNSLHVKLEIGLIIIYVIVVVIICLNLKTLKWLMSCSLI